MNNYLVQKDCMVLKNKEYDINSLLFPPAEKIYVKVKDTYLLTLTNFPAIAAYVV